MKLDNPKVQCNPVSLYAVRIGVWGRSCDVLHFHCWVYPPTWSRNSMTELELRKTIIILTLFVTLVHYLCSVFPHCLVFSLSVLFLVMCGTHMCVCLHVYLYSSYERENVLLCFFPRLFPWLILYILSPFSCFPVNSLTSFFFRTE